MTTVDLAGVFPVFQTPFHPDETIDAETLHREIEWLYDNGVDGIVMAMVSETLRLSSEERDHLAGLACASSALRGPVIVGVGAESGHTAERHARHAEEVGAAAVMATPPIAAAAGADELFAYYERLFRAVDIPVVVQDASGYVGAAMPLDMQAALLAEFGDRVLYKPEAVPIGPRLSELRDATGGRARVFEGSGGIALVDSYRRGIVGTMPGADLCWAIVALWDALVAGDLVRIDAINGPLSSLITLQSSLDAFVAVEKHLLVKQGVFGNVVMRGPLGFALDPETRTEVDRLFDLLAAAV